MLTDCIKLFFLFSKIGLFSIGGGYVMLPMMRRELVEKRGWLSDQELLDYYALSQAVPGIIATNTSTFVGFKRAGFAGAFSATAGMIFPSLVVIIAIAVFFTRMQENIIVQKAFTGIRIAVAALLVITVKDLFQKSVHSILSGILVFTAFALIVFAGISPVPVILAGVICALIGTKAIGGKK
ncbi:MAG TPA: chromate transporter [Spirochaetota bacterium]|jgi:chromate transporter|nr:chromate transporter [Spirochaetota bacterium]HQO22140.1 chromate transporter [Spirochaetota bacterium]HQQ23369.1 chromate transporter [Spirochaetota bacterium]